MGDEILVVCGLAREAGIAAGEGVATVAGGGVRAALEGRLLDVKRDSIRAVVSFGLAGALDASLQVGDIFVPDRVLSLDGDSWATDPEMRVRWSRLGLGERDRPRLQRGASFEAPLRGAPHDEDGGGIHGPPHAEMQAEGEPRSTHAASERGDRIATSDGNRLLGVDAPVLGVAEKARLRAVTGAGAVDMESHVAARYAADHGLPFAVLRVVSDGAGRTLPAVAGAAMRPDGSVDVFRVVRGLARDPRQLPALVSTARDAGRAFRALGRVRGLLGPAFGLHL